jgi:hypothetical protein
MGEGWQTELCWIWGCHSSDYDFCRVQHANCLLLTSCYAYFPTHEDGGDKFLRNVRELLPNYTELERTSSYSNKPRTDWVYSRSISNRFVGPPDVCGAPSWTSLMQPNKMKVKYRCG